MPRLLHAAQEETGLHAVQSTTKALLLVLAIGLATLSGCDPVRTIRQSVTVKVADDHGVPAPGVQVTMKESWESKNREGGAVPQFWQDEPWLTGVTDAQGQAVIWVEQTALDWEKGTKAPASRDCVSNHEFMIRLNLQNAQDETRVAMKPGAVCTGKRHSVIIQEIGKPEYIQTK